MIPTWPWGEGTTFVLSWPDAWVRQWEFGSRRRGNEQVKRTTPESTEPMNWSDRQKGGRTFYGRSNGHSQLIQRGRRMRPIVRSSLLGFLTALLTMVLAACPAKPLPTDDSVAYEPYTCVRASLPNPPAPLTGTPQRIAVIGDSYTDGSPQGGSAAKGWARLVTADLRVRGFDVVTVSHAEGGSGYLNPGTKTHSVFEDKVGTTVRRDDRLVVFFGSRNDSGGTPADYARATCDALRAAQLAAPSARLLVIGPPWVNGNPPKYILRDRDILRERASDLGAYFRDPVADRWFADRPDLIGTDGVHPTDAGHQYMADRISPVMAELLIEQTPAHS